MNAHTTATANEVLSFHRTEAARTYEVRHRNHGWTVGTVEESHGYWHAIGAMGLTGHGKNRAHAAWSLYRKVDALLGMDSGRYNAYRDEVRNVLDLVVQR